MKKLTVFAGLLLVATFAAAQTATVLTELSEKEREQLNGRIRGILNNVVLAKEDLLRELKDTIQKKSRDS